METIREMLKTCVTQCRLFSGLSEAQAVARVTGHADPSAAARHTLLWARQSSCPGCAVCDAARNILATPGTRGGLMSRPIHQDSIPAADDPAVEAARKETVQALRDVARCVRLETEYLNELAERYNIHMSDERGE